MSTTIFGVGLSAVLAVLIFLVPIYILFVKPVLDKRYASMKRDSANKKSASDAISTKKNLLLDQSNVVPIKDLLYLADKLSPDSTHMEVLFAVLTTPENIEWSIQDVERAENIYNDRLEKNKKTNNEKKKKDNGIGDFDDIFEQGGWADDDEDEKNNDAMLKSKQAEVERKAEMERLKQATGQSLQILEGIDDGVLGQKWVEKSLAAAGVWPPKDLFFLNNCTFDYNGKQMSALEHPGLRRLLCMTIGRLNSMYLNGHPQLLEAGAKKLIDQTYFRSSMEFRQRAAVVLDAALRVGMMVRSSRLVNTILETICMFKIGTNLGDNAVSWFNNLMMKQYNVLPRMTVKGSVVSTPDEKTIVSGDVSEVQLDVERPHAENFLRQKIDMFQKQGIPPQVGLSTYREAWWFLVRMKRMDGETPLDPFERELPGFKQAQFSPEVLSKFEREKPEFRLVTAWPMMVQNVAQKSGKVKIQFKAPSVPGKYQFTVSIKSQEFMGADQDIDIDVVVESAEKAKREPKTAKTPPALNTQAPITSTSTDESKDN